MNMSVYLVGGAVRDRLLGLPVIERDWVVVGAVPDDLIKQGYRQVGKDFPVFLHPGTGDEYALARRERKVAAGYHGFAVETGREISLHDDLLRRDLTINAMAMDAAGQLVDPHGGMRDLQHRVLRHVSPAFVEDPLRVLRVARFAARFAGYGFTVAAETMALMRQLSRGGELAHLVPERVWQECIKALSGPSPSVFFSTLKACDALQPLFPELSRLFQVPQSPQHHPEGDCGVHSLLVLDQAARLSDDPVIRFAALVHDLGKGVTPEQLWPSHPGHEQAGVLLLEALAQRYRLPHVYRQLALAVMRFHGEVHRVLTLDLRALDSLMHGIGAWQSAAYPFEAVLTACKADCRGRTGFEDADYPQAAYLRSAREAGLAIDRQLPARLGYQGEAYGRALGTLRRQALRRWRRAFAGFSAASVLR